MVQMQIELNIFCPLFAFRKHKQNNNDNQVS